MTAIEFNNISKQYRLGLVSTNTLSHDLNRWWATNIRGKEDPYLKIGDTNDRTTKGESDYVWALRDIDFKVEQGDVMGIIGKNGAGKSTLLKILSKVTTPTTGTIKARGRIASLLEVGTGFHPEMTGRENIFMNGCIMGMNKSEIKNKLDEIIDFAGVERYIDTPVKRYSSGMTVRLGFAIAAFLEPEILVVDEVLAVGDAEFQKKAIGKMQDVSSGEGRTVLFVSHNMTAVKNLCKTGVLMENGGIKFSGDIESVIDQYLSIETSKGIVNNEWKVDDINNPGNEKLKILKSNIEFTGSALTVNIPFTINTEFVCFEDLSDFKVSMHLYDATGSCVFALPTEIRNLSKGSHRASFHIPKNFMNDGLYYVDNFFASETSNLNFWHKKANSFEVIEDREVSSWHWKWVGAVRPTFLKTTLL